MNGVIREDDLINFIEFLLKWKDLNDIFRR